MTNVSKKIYHLDVKDNELNIYFEDNNKTTIKKASTVSQVFDVLSITHGTDDELNFSAEFEDSVKFTKMWEYGYTTWLISIQKRIDSDKNLNFSDAFKECMSRKYFS